MASPFRQRSAEVEDRIRNHSNPDQELSLQLVAPALLQDRGISIDLKDVSKQFGDQVVLKRISLTINPGSFVAIVGRSGCGKSTLLRLLSGLDSVSSGSLKLQGQEIQGIHGNTRFMFQDARLLPWNSVLDNVKLGLSGVRSSDVQLRAYEALKLVGLEERAGEWPSVLSGGQRQRVALARALVGNPHLLLFDEPLGALDALTRIDMQRLIEDLWEQSRFTAVMVTHDVSEAVALADRVILIEEGQIALDLNITLARPRHRDAGFAHFEQVILDRVLAPAKHSAARTNISLYDI
ncbi:ATP-binding cassette domain-containing protein [Paenibacillus lutrae]|uniref:ATP-binding cassette domain-containing protein n=1 Tax=Paenibacillus lutrae TaxID=2078573 RepID=A0A7X3JZ70_9BACL|nr:ATP-binding cassette domain-containing protein [Paenibacillus lutrae]MVO99706.1 ATP-binding cassette domain-containing protein [Paenibacillus lutrae]